MTIRAASRKFLRRPRKTEEVATSFAKPARNFCWLRGVPDHKKKIFLAAIGCEIARGFVPQRPGPHEKQTLFCFSGPRTSPLDLAAEWW